MLLSPDWSLTMRTQSLVMVPRCGVLTQAHCACSVPTQSPNTMSRPRMVTSEALEQSTSLLEDTEGEWWPTQHRRLVTGHRVIGWIPKKTYILQWPMQILIVWTMTSFVANHESTKFKNIKTPMLNQYIVKTLQIGNEHPWRCCFLPIIIPPYSLKVLVIIVKCL